MSFRLVNRGAWVQRRHYITLDKLEEISVSFMFNSYRFIVKARLYNQFDCLRNIACLSILHDNLGIHDDPAQGIHSPNIPDGPYRFIHKSKPVYNLHSS